MKYESAKKFIIKEQYYKRSRPKESLAQFEAYRTSKPAVVKVLIKKDPVLKKYPKVEKEAVKHEIREAKLTYTKFKDRSKSSRAHDESKHKEPAWLRPAIRKLRKEQGWKPI
jgi:hypothetical protein